MEYAAKSNLKSVNLELGGKSPLVIFDDANGKYFLINLYFLFLNAIYITSG